MVTRAEPVSIAAAVPDSHAATPEKDERRLLDAFRKKDRAAFDALFARYGGRVYSFALYLTGGSRADAEDIVQETFVAAFQGADTYRGGSRLLTWLLGIALRRFRDGNRRYRPVFEAWEEDAVSSSPSRNGSRVEDEALASVSYRRALSTLDEPLRVAFLLVAAQGMTHREAAAVLDAPVGTVKWRVAEATKQLRTALSQDDETISERTSHVPTA